ncbi:MAG: dCMP deaminase family protein [Deltaproteobacteria bacterium]|nr:dCMP deaminase family protein [Deltaproteobacteria bacterium]
MASEVLPFPPTDSDDEFIPKWDDYWYEGAIWAARKSKDPRCRVGAIIVCDDVLVSSGFNGLARNVYDDPHVLHDVAEKLKLICHAEVNAILNAARQGVSLKGATIYVTKFPCLACCNAIVQAGIKRVYTHDDKYWNDDPADAEHHRKRSVLHQAKIDVIAPFHPDYAAQKRPSKKAPRSSVERMPALPLEQAPTSVTAAVAGKSRKNPKPAVSTKSHGAADVIAVERGTKVVEE